jgi:hypothetical protein
MKKRKNSKTTLKPNKKQKVVLNITDDMLFEIITFLPVHDLLKIKLVNKNWNEHYKKHEKELLENIIKNEKKIQAIVNINRLEFLKFLKNPKFSLKKQIMINENEKIIISKSNQLLTYSTSKLITNSKNI